LLIGNNTGDAQIRAGLPDSWIVGDKTGTCANGGGNDVAFFVTAEGKKYALAIYINALGLQADERAKLIASVANLAQRVLIE